MAAITVPISNIQRMIKRPIQLRVVEAIMNQLGLSKYFKVSWVDDDGRVVNPNALMDEDFNHFKFTTDAKNHVLIEATDISTPDRQQSLGFFSKRGIPAWYDSKYHLLIIPNAYHSEGKVAMQFQLNSRFQAERMYNTLKRKLARTNALTTSAEYRLPLVDELLYVMGEYHKRIVEQFEPDLTFLDYVKRNTNQSLIEIKNINGKIEGVGFLENQAGILIQHETSAEVELARGSNGIWTTTLEVSYHYQLPGDYTVEFKEVVGRRKLPNDLVPTKPAEKYEYFLDAIDSTFSKFANISEGSPYLNIPSWDNFTPSLPNHLHPFVTILAAPASDNVSVLDINAKLSAEGYYISDACKTYLLHHRETINDEHLHPLSIQVYHGNVPLNKRLWNLQEDGIIKLTEPSPVTELFRVVIIGSLDFTRFDQPNLKPTLSDGEKLINILPIFLPGVKPEDITRLPDGSVALDVFKELGEKVNKRYGINYDQRHLVTVTVGLFDILVLRKSE